MRPCHLSRHPARCSEPPVSSLALPGGRRTATAVLRRILGVQPCQTHNSRIQDRREASTCTCRRLPKRGMAIVFPIVLNCRNSQGGHPCKDSTQSAPASCDRYAMCWYGIQLNKPAAVQSSPKLALVSVRTRLWSMTVSGPGPPRTWSSATNEPCHYGSSRESQCSRDGVNSQHLR